MNRANTFYAPIVMLITAGVLAGCATDPVSGPGGGSGDAKITQNIEAQFDKQPDLGPPQEIEVQTKKHVVYLSGLVDSGVAVADAESVARQAKGVSDVVNMIAVEQ
jgi:osmotically-inducible protein OsmY